MYPPQIYVILRTTSDAVAENAFMICTGVMEMRIVEITVMRRAVVSFHLANEIYPICLGTSNMHAWKLDMPRCLTGSNWLALQHKL